jgi:hypothetical protein
MTRHRRKTVVEVKLRLYRGRQPDDALIHWLESLDRRPYGARSQAVREALCRGIAADEDAQGAPTASADALDLSLLRRVVEAAVASALSRFQLVGLDANRTRAVSSGDSGPPQEEPEATLLLDALGEELLIGEEDLDERNGHTLA